MSAPADPPIRQSLAEVRPGTLAELAALGDEVAALIRAGVPLEAGLEATAQDLPPRLGRLVRALAERMSEGQTLSAALTAERPGYPPVMMAVVEAGVRSGRVAEAVEGIAEVSHRLVELRGSMMRALIYPLTVLLLAYALLHFYLARVGPSLTVALEDFDAPAAAPMRELIDRAALWQQYWWAPLLALAIVLLAGWLLTGRPTSLEGGWLRGLFGWLPGLRRMFRSWDAARMTSLLALLVEQRIPWPEALRLAGQASGSRRLAEAGEGAARAVENGALDRPALREFGLPPLVAWALVTGAEDRRLPKILRETADTYQRQALADAELARTVWPIVALLALGATATLVYALLLFYPLSRLFDSLSRLGT